jgi:hypothetical protein
VRHLGSANTGRADDMTRTSERGMTFVGEATSSLIPFNLDSAIGANWTCPSNERSGHILAGESFRCPHRPQGPCRPPFRKAPSILTAESRFKRGLASRVGDVKE